MAEETKKAEQAETPETEKETVAKETQAQEQTVEETPAKAEEKKEKKKSKKKDKKDEKIEELNDRLLRNMAEFENFRNRSEKEKAAKFDMGAKNVVEKVLPIVDNFERGLAAVPEEEQDNAFVKGMEAVYKQFTTVLEEIGVTTAEQVETIAKNACVPGETIHNLAGDVQPVELYDAILQADAMGKLALGK